MVSRAHFLIQQARLPARLDAERGFDHATYSILAVTSLRSMGCPRSLAYPHKPNLLSRCG